MVTSTTELADLFYPGRNQPVGVLDRAMPSELRDVVSELAPTLGQTLAGPPDRTMDCRVACNFWRAALATRGIKAHTMGGEGIDDDVFVQYRFVPLERRSGYMEADSKIHRHYWLSVGDDQSLIDPTAHQFDDRGGVSIGRYVIDGVPAVIRAG